MALAACQERKGPGCGGSRRPQTGQGSPQSPRTHSQKGSLDGRMRAPFLAAMMQGLFCAPRPSASPLGMPRHARTWSTAGRSNSRPRRRRASSSERSSHRSWRSGCPPRPSICVRPAAGWSTTRAAARPLGLRNPPSAATSRHVRRSGRSGAMGRRWRDLPTGPGTPRRWRALVGHTIRACTLARSRPPPISMPPSTRSWTAGASGAACEHSDGSSGHGPRRSPALMTGVTCGPLSETCLPSLARS